VPNHDWGYHDYRDAEIDNFLPAAEEMGRRGYYALRMGEAVKETVVSDSPRVIDYASNGRSDFMDIYLLANCRFFLSSSSGLTGLAHTFRVPLAYVDQVPLEYEPRGKRDMFIPKKIWLRNEKRFLTFREIVESGAGRFLRGDEFEALGLELVENSKDDVMALAVEMDERLEGKWDTSDEDTDLQQRYWTLFDETTLCYNSPSRIGAAFLRQNRNLLD
jgi:putative glycosyltransferase (TIGR04372 family)